jgi:hypothetical protein
MRRLCMLAVYVSVSTSTVRMYDGMSPSTVANLLDAEGVPYSLISKQTYTDFITSRPAQTSQETPERVALKLIITDKTKTAAQRLQALIDYLDIR